MPAAQSTNRMGCSRTSAFYLGRRRYMRIDAATTIVDQLNTLLEMELSGVTRYLHYSFMVFGANRIPITAWFREQAVEGVNHAVLVGEKITAYGGEPTVRVRPVPETRHQSLRAMLEESRVFEAESLAEYHKLREAA